jgi:hypothetical protein
MREVHKQRLARKSEELVTDAQNRISFVRIERDSITKDPKRPETEKTAAAKHAESEINQIQTEARKKLEELEKAEDEEIDEAALFRDWIPLYNTVQTQLTLVEGKFRSTVQLLDEYLQGLGQRLHKVLEKTIDVKPENSSSVD